MPAENGSVTPSAAAVAMAASAALPPAFRMSMPTWVASASTLATAPPLPVITGTFDTASADPPAAAGADSAAAGVVTTSSTETDRASNDANFPAAWRTMHHLHAGSPTGRRQMGGRAR